MLDPETIGRGSDSFDAYDKLVDRMTVKNRIVVRGPGWELEMEEDNTKKLMKAIPKLLRGLRNFTVEDWRQRHHVG